MSILIDIQNSDWSNNEEFVSWLGGGIPEGQIDCYPEIKNSADVTMLACDRLRPGLVKKLPNLKLVQKLGAGAETMINDPDLPQHVRITRLKPEIVALEMARFCAAHVLADAHNLEFHRIRQNEKTWDAIPPKNAPETVVGVLGLGHIGGITARLFSSMGFLVLGWSKTEKSIAGVQNYCGLDEIDHILSQSDYIICILPSTMETTDLISWERLSKVKPGSMLINVGRGTLISEPDLIDALDNGPLSHAVLDVFKTEPLPEDHPFWNHPKITITPHASGWRLDDGISVVADNYQNLVNNRPLIHEVDRNSGY